MGHEIKKQVEKMGIYAKNYGNEKAASKGGLIIVSNALLINHLSGADTRSRTRDLLITRT